MKKIYCILCAVIMIAVVSLAFNNVASYSDEAIKKMAFTEVLSKPKVYLLMGRPITSSVNKYSKSYKCSSLELRRIITAMVILETGLLKSQAVQVNSLTGIKAIGTRPSFRFKTTEYVKGVKIYIDQDFSAFFSFEDAIDNLFILWKYPRYSKLHSAKNTNEFIIALGKSGYATDPKHAEKLLRILKEF